MFYFSFPSLSFLNQIQNSRSPFHSPPPLDHHSIAGDPSTTILLPLLSNEDQPQLFSLSLSRYLPTSLVSGSQNVSSMQEVPVPRGSSRSHTTSLISPVPISFELRESRLQPLFGSRLLSMNVEAPKRSETPETTSTISITTTISPTTTLSRPSTTELRELRRFHIYSSTFNRRRKGRPSVLWGFRSSEISSSFIVDFISFTADLYSLISVHRQRKGRSAVDFIGGGRTVNIKFGGWTFCEIGISSHFLNYVVM
ncbi:hypothetical protein L6452_01387 [Arctium lappa]|uniref:Uncharacterized protein n=1 Tax=Arctium lappa TaxID=4217 RepID=A0ACB9FHF7_ARCLA|nr:hypothetical protein L6452_01387 [Arctium lappa]